MVIGAEISVPVLVYTDATTAGCSNGAAIARDSIKGRWSELILSVVVTTPTVPNGASYSSCHHVCAWDFSPPSNEKNASSSSADARLYCMGMTLVILELTTTTAGFGARAARNASMRVAVSLKS